MMLAVRATHLLQAVAAVHVTICQMLLAAWGKLLPQAVEVLSAVV